MSALFRLKFLVLFILTSLILIFTPGVFAQTNQATTSAQSTTQYQALPAYVSPQSPVYANLVINNFSHALLCIGIGQSYLGPCLDYKWTKDLQGQVKAVPVLSSVNISGGLVGAGGSLLTALYVNKPLDSAEFLSYTGKNFGLISEAHAQVGGSGNSVLSPVFVLWQVSRDFSYLIMILIFILVGLMVMFRYKLNPQTVVSVQLALPGLVIGLIMVTFSYFLASLITDLAYVGTNLVGYYFAQAIRISDPGFTQTGLSQQLADQNLLKVGSSYTQILSDGAPLIRKGGTIWNVADQIIKQLPYNPIDWLSPQNIVRLFLAAVTYQIANSFGTALGVVAGGAITVLAPAATPLAIVGAPLISGFAGPALGTIAALAAYADPSSALAIGLSIIAVFAILYTVFRLLMKLISNYLQIIFLTITAPFYFLVASLPGRQDVAVDWMRNMLCNVLAFPAVIAVFYFAAFLIGNREIAAFGINAQFNPTNSPATLPLFGDIDLSFLRKVLAFGAILITPAIPDIICQAIGKPGRAGGLLEGAINQAVSGGRNYYGQYIGNISKVAQDVGTWKKRALGERTFTGGTFGEVQYRLARRTGHTLGTIEPPVSWDRRVGNWFERIRRSQASTTPESEEGVSVTGRPGSWHQ